MTCLTGPVISRSREPRRWHHLRGAFARLPHRSPHAIRGPGESDVLVHGSRCRWDQL